MGISVGLDILGHCMVGIRQGQVYMNTCTHCRTGVYLRGGGAFALSIKSLKMGGIIAQVKGNLNS